MLGAVARLRIECVVSQHPEHAIGGGACGPGLPFRAHPRLTAEPTPSSNIVSNLGLDSEACSTSGQTTEHFVCSSHPSPS